MLKHCFASGHRQLRNQNPSFAMHVKHFTVILKVVERCNINCDYCYYFNIGDDSWNQNPPYLGVQTMDTIIHRFKEYLETTRVDLLSFVFHGGEPLMSKIENLDRFIQLARDSLSAFTRLNFAIQTNGTIYSDEWMAFFERHQLAVGVSIDGPPEYNDLHRRTKSNLPTHHMVSSFVDHCSALLERKAIPALGTITVINNRFDIKKIVAHLQAEFELSRMSFIMPDDAANDILFNEKKAKEYGQALIDLYNENVLDRRIRSKEILKFMSKLQPTHQESTSQSPDSVEYIGVTIQSSGVMKVNEELIATGKWRKEFPVLNLSSGNIKDYIESSTFKEYLEANDRIPSQCSNCKWKNVCRGGSLQERRNPENGFNSRSIFCQSYQQLYEYMYQDLIATGYPEAKLRSKLELFENEAQNESAIH